MTPPVPNAADIVFEENTPFGNMWRRWVAPCRRVVVFMWVAGRGCPIPPVINGRHDYKYYVVGYSRDFSKSRDNLRYRVFEGVTDDNILSLQSLLVEAHQAVYHGGNDARP